MRFTATTRFQNGRVDVRTELGVESSSPPVWGPPLWNRLHRGALNLETTEKRAALLREITSSIPPLCGCRNHWQSILEEHPAQLSTAEDFFSWTVLAHNLVNRKLHKPEFTP